MAWGKTVNFNELYTESIPKVTNKGIEYAKSTNCVIKLIGSSKKTEDAISAKVSPCMLKNTHPLSQVRDVYNAIFVKGNMSGDTMYYGSGAGKLPTASAVVADMVDAINHKGRTVKIHWGTEEVEKVANINQVPVSALIRVGFDNLEKAKAESLEVFNHCSFVDLNTPDDEFALIISNETEGTLSTKLEILNKKVNIKDVRNFIRMGE